MSAKTLSRLSAIFWFAISLALATPAVTADDEALAKELKTLLLQQRQLERNAREYASVLEALLAEGKPDSGNANAATALKNQLDRTEIQLVALARRRQELERALGLTPNPASPAAPAAATTAKATPQSADTPALSRPAPISASDNDAELAARAENSDKTAEPIASTPAAPTSDNVDTSRLTELLSDYYSGGASAAGPDGEAEAGEDASELGFDKVLLSGAEGIVMLDRFSERLARGPQSRRRESDLVYHVAVSRGGKLVNSDSHSMQSLGKTLYVGKASLASGDVTISVRRNNWFLALTGDTTTECILTLRMPEYGEVSLHVIPVAELKAAGLASPPPWLPYLGSDTKPAS